MRLPPHESGVTFPRSFDADDATLGSDLSGGDNAVEATARPEIDDPLSGSQRALRERIADAGERFDGTVRQSGDDRICVAQRPRQRPSGVEMKDGVRIDRDFSIFGFDLFAQGSGINGQGVTHSVLPPTPWLVRSVGSADEKGGYHGGPQRVRVFT